MTHCSQGELLHTPHTGESCNDGSTPVSRVVVWTVSVPKGTSWPVVGPCDEAGVKDLFPYAENWMLRLLSWVAAHCAVRRTLHHWSTPWQPRTPQRQLPAPLCRSKFGRSPSFACIMALATRVLHSHQVTAGMRVMHLPRALHPQPAWLSAQTYDRRLLGCMHIAAMTFSTDA